MVAASSAAAAQLGRAFRERAPWSVLMLILATSILVEVTLFNSAYFRVLASGQAVAELPLSAFEIEGGSLEGDALVVRSGTRIVAEVPSVPIVSVALLMEDAPGVFVLDMATRDAGNKASFRDYFAHAIVHTQVQRSKTLVATSMGETYALRMDFADVRGDARLRGVVLNEPPPFHFSLLRVLLLLTISSAVYLIAWRRLHLIEFDANESLHRRLFMAAVTVSSLAIVMVALSVTPLPLETGVGLGTLSPINPAVNSDALSERVFNPDGRPDDQPVDLGESSRAEATSPSSNEMQPSKEADAPPAGAAARMLDVVANRPTPEVLASDQYYRVVDAWSQGRLDLDIPVDPRLSRLSNPHDPSLRAAAGLRGVGSTEIGAAGTFPIDYAFFRGRFYSYFGVAPPLLTYYPFYVLTGRLLSPRVPVTLFALVFAVMASLLLLEVLKRWFPRSNLLLVLLAIPALVLSSNVFILVSSPQHFQAASASAAMFTASALYFGLRGLTEARRSAVFLGAAGVCVAGAAGSRPNTSLYVLALLPLLIAYLRAEAPTKRKVAGLIAFAVPVAFGGLGIMWHNWARFGSLVEFGANYQLTGSDIRFNDFRTLAILRPALHHYFLQPVQTLARFPFVTPSVTAISYAPDRYYYAFPVMTGLLYYPVIGASLLFPLLSREVSKIGRGTLLLLGTLALGMCLLIFGEAGVDFRYTTDFAVWLAMLGVLSLLLLARELGTDSYRAGIVVAMSAAALGITIVLALLLSVSGEMNLFYATNPKWYVSLAQLFDVLFY